MAKAKVLELAEAERLELENGFRNGKKHCFRVRRAMLLKAEDLSSEAVRKADENESCFGKCVVAAFQGGGCARK